MDLNLFGIGPLELVFFIILLLLLFGPNDLVRMARNIGRFLSRLVRSENYRVIQQASQELRTIPERLVREAQLDDIRSTMADTAAAAKGAASPPPAPSPAVRQPPAQPALAAWTQEMPAAAPAPPAPAPAQPAAPASPFAAWTQELPGDSAPPAPRTE